MDSGVLWTALALVLVIEGLLPFAWPAAWRQAFVRLIQMNDGQLRFFGLCSIASGLVMLWLLG